MSNTKRTGQTSLYEHFSRDDEMQGESNSITNQKQLLESYAKRNGFANIYHYTDDGVRGTVFDRKLSNDDKSNRRKQSIYCDRKRYELAWQRLLQSRATTS